MMKEFDLILVIGKDGPFKYFNEAEVVQAEVLALNSRLCWKTTTILFGKHIRYTTITCVPEG
jgi:hypothetical protein